MDDATVTIPEALKTALNPRVGDSPVDKTAPLVVTVIAAIVALLVAFKVIPADFLPANWLVLVTLLVGAGYGIWLRHNGTVPPK